VEYMLAQGGEEAGLAALDAWRAGGGFSSWKRAFINREVKTFRRRPVPDDHSDIENFNANENRIE
jgi:hypothetical protein